MRGTVAKKLRKVAKAVSEQDKSLVKKTSKIFVLDDVLQIDGSTKKDYVEKDFVTVSWHPNSARGTYQRMKAEFKNV